MTEEISKVIYPNNKINGIKTTTIAIKIEMDEYFNFDWILQATGLTIYAKTAPNIIMFKTGKININEITSRKTINKTGGVKYSLMSNAILSP